MPFKKLFENNFKSNIFWIFLLNVLLFENKFNTDIFKIYSTLFICSILFLCLLFIEFEQTDYLQNLNLIFLYLNLVLFVSFFTFGVYFFVFEIDVLILYQKYSIRFFMILLVIFSFLCLKKKVLVKDERAFKDNKYIHRSNLLLFSKLDPVYNLAMELPYICLYFGTLIYILREFIEFHWIVFYFLKVLNFLNFLILILFLFLFLVFSIYFIPFVLKRNKVYTKKFKSDKYDRLYKN